VGGGGGFAGRPRRARPGRYAAVAAASTLLGLAVLALVTTGAFR